MVNTNPIEITPKANIPYMNNPWMITSELDVNFNTNIL